jgi:hypothetical protein
MFDERSFGPYTGPANVSRLHQDAVKATSGPPGSLLLQVSESSGTIKNSLFDSSLITYDLAYCTTVIDSGGKDQIGTLSYFSKILEYFKIEPQIVDIGCGQGEFVQSLRQEGLSAVGYDPVLRVSEEFLHKRFWTTEDPPGDLYVMRCVLPHIEDPWNFLDSIWQVNPDALVLVEYQSWDWICSNSVWNQICHDHVHQFRKSNFLERQMLLASGSFQEGEWEWVLLGTGKLPVEMPNFSLELLESHESLATLNSDREITLDRLNSLTEDFNRLTVWGAAAKGAMLVYSFISRLDIEISAVDIDLNRQHKYLEGSGVQILNPHRLITSNAHELILVANPRHIKSIKSQFGNRGNFEITSVSEILKD